MQVLFADVDSGPNLKLQQKTGFRPNSLPQLNENQAEDFLILLWSFIADG